jgi:hypothetical protein
MEYPSQTIRRLTELYEKAVSQYATLLHQRFEERVDLTVLRLLFRYNELDLTFEELEIAMYEQEVSYNRLRKIDEQLVLLQNEIEQVDASLDNL